MESIVKFFKEKYNYACNLANSRLIYSYLIENYTIENSLDKLENHKAVYNYIININSETIKKVGKKFEEIIINTISKQEDEISRISFLFDFITNYITYSEEYFNHCIRLPLVDGFEFDFKNNMPVPIRPSAEEMLVLGQGVCEDISNLMIYLGEKLNLKIDKISCSYNEYLHQLNTITLSDGKTYLIDATRLIRNDKTKDECFLVSKEKLNKDKNYTFRDHQETWSYISKYPSFDIQSEVLIESLESVAPEIENANNASKQRRKQK